MVDSIGLPDAGHGSVTAPVTGIGDVPFQRVLDLLPAGAYICDRQGRITCFNAQVVRLWGRAPKPDDSADRFCGSFKLFTVEGEAMRHDQCCMALALREGNGFNGREVVVERPDGTRRGILARANPMHDADGSLVGALGILVDLGERDRLPEDADSTGTARRALDVPAVPEPGVFMARTPLRILVVDDNDDAASSLALLLRTLGNDVRTARDGVEALELADAFSPQVYLLDLGLPLMSGSQIARRIRERPGGDSVRLIAVTAWGAERDRIETRTAGFDHHLVKPVDPLELMRLVAVQCARAAPGPPKLRLV